MKPFPNSPKKFSKVSHELQEIGFILVADKSNGRHNRYFVLNTEGNKKFKKKYNKLDQILEDIENNKFAVEVEDKNERD